MTEGTIIERIQSLVAPVENGVVGIGDDAAVIPTRLLQENLVLSTDALIEGTHFLRDQIAPEDLAYKSLAVNLSDLAAMGSKPRFVLLSLALPKDLSGIWIETFLMSFAKAARQFDVAVLGGNTAASREIAIHVTAIGDAGRDNILFRSGARSGDILCVTKTLGDSAAGLEVLKRNLSKTAYAALLERHFRPMPQVEEGLFLASEPSVHAMMDLSDGLASDLVKMAAASGGGAAIQAESLPISMQSEQLCRDIGIDAVDLAMSGGEDYALLVVVAAASYRELAEAYMKRFSAPLVRIGEITQQGVDFFRDGKRYIPKTSPFSHFA